MIILLIFCWICCWRPYLGYNCGFSLLGVENHSAADSFLCLLTEVIPEIVQQSLCHNSFFLCCLFSRRKQWIFWITQQEHEHQH